MVRSLTQEEIDAAEITIENLLKMGFEKSMSLDDKYFFLINEHTARLYYYPNSRFELKLIPSHTKVYFSTISEIQTFIKHFEQ